MPNKIKFMVKYYKRLKNNNVDGLKSVDTYKVLKDNEFVSCRQVFVTYEGNHIKLSFVPESEWIEITYDELSDLLQSTGWGSIYTLEYEPKSNH